MTTNEPGSRLHDRATRGETLSADEQAALLEWYAAQDQLEQQSLARRTAERDVAALQTQVNTALEQMLVSARRVQNLATENETLRQEIAVLRRQLANSPVWQMV